MIQKAFYLLVLLSMLFTLSTFGQAKNGTTVRGLVLDSAGHALNNATVSLVSVADSSRHWQSSTDAKGFEFSNIDVGTYTLIVSYTGYTPVRQTVKVTGKQSDLIQPVILAIRSSLLKEVIVKAAPPAFKIKGDTVSYRADAVKTRVNSPVEDLLKKLPGMEVDKEGNILFQGKFIKKIYIDGKDYFLNDPRLITQNLTADMISRVDVFDDPSKESRLSGRKDVQPDKAINLKLKKGVSLALTGKAYAGFGSKNGYIAGASANSFVKNRAVNGSLTSNNINDLTEPGTNPLLAYGRSSSERALVHYSDNWGKKMLVSMGYNETRRESDRRQSVGDTRSFLTDSLLNEIRQSNNKTKNIIRSFQGSWEISPDSSRYFMIQSTVTPGRARNTSNDSTLTSISIPGTNYKAGDGTIRNSLSNAYLNMNNTILYNHNTGNRILSVNLSQNSSSAEKEGSLNSVVHIYSAVGNITSASQTDQYFTQSDRHSDYGAELNDKELLRSGKSLNISYKYEDIADANNRTSFNYDSATSKYDRIDSLTTTSFKSGTMKHQAGIVYENTVHKFNYNIGITIEHSTLISHDAIRMNTIRQGFNNLLPAASLSYNPGTTGATRQFNADYTSQSQQPDPSQLQPFTDNRNPFQLITGNPGLKQQVSHLLSLRYYSLDARTMRNLLVDFSAGYQQHSIIPAISILPGGIQSMTYVNREGSWNLEANAHYEFPLGAQNKNRVRLDAGSRYDRSLDLLNGKENFLDGISGSQNTGLHLTVFKKMELDAEGRFAYNFSKYSGASGENTSGLTQNYKLALSYDLPCRLLLKSDYSLQLISAQAGLPRSSIYVWNASLLKNVFRNGHGEFKLAVFDLLKSDRGFSQRVSVNSIERTTNNVFGRLFLLTFTYHLRSLGQSSKKQHN